MPADPATDPADGEGAVRELLLAARAHDGRPEVEETGPLPREFRGGRHLLARDDAGTLVGYAHLDTAGDALGNQIVELVVHPRRRRAGVGGSLVAEVLSVEHPLRIWSHGDHPAAVRLAARFGLARVRELHRMRLGPTGELPAPVLPDQTTVRTFEPGRDEEAVVAVNARAFDWHPEQGQLTVEELVATERESWFDPAGFLLAERAGRIVGFHWTKIHPDGVGEVYVVGVDPDAQGGGLGRALTLVGLHHLRQVGADEIILYVESDNLPAVTVYSRLGFFVEATDVAYQH
ncbi:mycothiol synthase [Actinophytocola xanthii]|uniref:Mycothiol acetyltransferase n=1 Tax=Actinophytocola xanthii TaxID=1912961 RepID=A0A1Q8C0P3_9PSEU|nr:mycothiol synthase [Actinophytocola xanthii]OLF07924.1 mycothiol synthase [Actinophytocola xanthii]